MTARRPSVRWKGGVRVRAPGRDQVGSLYLSDAGLYFIPVDSASGDSPLPGHLMAYGTLALVGALSAWAVAMFAGTPGQVIDAGLDPNGLLYVGLPLGVALLGAGLALRLLQRAAFRALCTRLHQDTLDEDMEGGMSLEQRYSMEGRAWRVLTAEMERAERSGDGVRLVTTLGEDVVLEVLAPDASAQAGLRSALRVV